MKKLAIIIGTIAATLCLVLGLTGTVFADDTDPVNRPAAEKADGAKRYRGYAGQIASLADGVLTLEKRGGWTVDVNLTDETKYGLPGVGEITADEFATYVADGLAAEETIKAVVRADRAEDGTITAKGVRVMPKLVVGAVTSVEELELIIETRDGETAIVLNDETKYRIPGQGQVTAEEFTAYYDEAIVNEQAVKVAVRATEDEGVLTAKAVKVIKGKRGQKRALKIIERQRNRRANRAVDEVVQPEA
ncbi:MAG: hypothetical protein HN929_07270 [Chloroflexi bacterium]|jgi:hypothetical protein|nr:hypothetical protein [Chloroflexota bacterium]MBT7081248.1 hypothetical protein [Chloroflexota bacterium]MBT7288917.1 hypothetical protein [Chloroflexota bacterium]